MSENVPGSIRCFEEWHEHSEQRQWELYKWRCAEIERLQAAIAELDDVTMDEGGRHNCERAAKKIRRLETERKRAVELGFEATASGNKIADERDALRQEIERLRAELAATQIPGFTVKRCEVCGGVTIRIDGPQCYLCGCSYLVTGTLLEEDTP